MTDRERALEESVKELGKLLSELSHGGECSHRISIALHRARKALRYNST
jgi:hypothetical protein